MIKYEILGYNEDAPKPKLFGELPSFPKKGCITESDLGNGCHLQCHWLCDDKDFADYVKLLKKAGFSLWQENNIADNLFCVLANDTLAVHVQYFPYWKQVRVIAEPKSTLPVRKEDNVYTDRGCKPTVTQLWTDFHDVDCGMSYVIQLCDFSFVIIDGGMMTHNEAQQLRDFLVKHAPEGEKPVVAGWILTHHHSDHVACFEDFADRFVDEVTVEAIVYNNVSYRKAKGVGEYLIDEQRAIEEAVAKFPESTKLYKPHAGEVYYIRDAVFTCLHTQDEMHLRSVRNTNSTSVVFRMELGSKSVMWLGDTNGDVSRHLLYFYGDTLKSDIVQIAHHGYGDAHHVLYVPINAEIALWPCPDYRVDVIDALTKFLKENTDLKTIYFAYDKDHTVEM